MSRTNPEKAVRAILPLPITVAPGVVIEPMTLGMYAALERIGSPMVTGDEPKDTLDLIPSLYLLTHGADAIFEGNVLEMAMAWAKTQPVAIVPLIRKAAYRQMSAMTDVIPELSPEDLKKKGATTGGSPTTPRSRRKRSDGAGARSSGKCPPASSRC